MPLNNFGTVSASVARAAQPDRHGFEQLRRMGYTVVVKLNHEDESPLKDEADQFQPGVVYAIESIPIVTEPDTTLIARIVAQLRDYSADGERVLVHCTYGRDRTGLVVAAYRLLVDHWTYDDAIHEMEIYGVKKFANGLYRRTLKKLSELPA